MPLLLFRKICWRRGAGSNRRIKVLQTSALPLGYRADQLADFFRNIAQSLAPVTLVMRMQLRSLATRLQRSLEHPSPFQLTEALFLRVLGLVYLAAFASFWPQMIGLFGIRGIVSVARILPAIRAQLGSSALYQIPTLFWATSSNATLTGSCILGCVFALLLTAGVFSRAASIACWILYLSIVSVGQPFTSFQWDALLLEAGFLAIFSGSPWLVWAYRFLLFRLMFESGAVKLLSGDPSWRNFHALRFHFMTQPLPNPVAYYAYRFPTPLLDFMTAATIVIELIAPFLLFGPRRLRHIAVALLMFFQLTIVLTGNYAFFNLLSLALCLWGLDDQTFAPLSRILKKTFPRFAYPTRLLTPARITASIVVGVLMLVGALQLIGIFKPQALRFAGAPLNLIAPFELVNNYGLFATMTTTRPELVIEGSNDQATWREYSFRYKPGELHRGLPQIAPYQPRLDWQMWFAALGEIQENRWVGNLLYAMMTGEGSVLGLLEPPPFTKPPRYVRILLYDYSFTAPADRARTGAVWQRQLRGTWFGPAALTAR